MSPASPWNIRSGDRERSFVSISLIAIAFIAMCAWTWNTWADPITNGRELYLPWRIAQGETLYRDLPHNAGPFSQYVNGLLFRVAGANVRTLVIGNLAWLVVLVLLVRSIWMRIAGPLAATVACLVLLTLFSFAQFTYNAGHNFVLPYAHELTHGTILSFLSIACLMRYLQRERASFWLGAAGAAVGCALLTRAEIFLAIAPSIAVGWIVSAYARKRERRRFTLEAIVFVGSAIAPALVAIFLLGLAMPIRMAMSGTFGEWSWLLDERLWRMPYYQAVAGTDRVDANVGRSIASAAMYGGMIALAVGAGWMLRSRRASAGTGSDARRIALFATPIIVLGGAFVLHDALEWQYVARGLNVLVAAIATALLIAVISKRRDEIDDVLVGRLVVAGFALLLLLARMPLRVVLFDHGFVYAMPAALLVVAAMVDWIPKWLDRAGGFGAIVRIAAISVFCVVIGRYLWTFQRLFNGADDKPIRMAEGANTLRFSTRAIVMADMLAEIRARRASVDETLLVVPEGTLLNVFAGMRNPIGYTHLMPPDVMMYGADHVRAAIQRTPPDWIVVAKSNPIAFGFDAFERDYGREIWRAIEPRYVEVHRVGDEKWWMKLYKRR